MAQDLFSRTSTEFGGAISADSTQVVFSGDNFDQGIGLILDQVQVMYQQAIQRAYDLTEADRTYLIIGRTDGMANMSGVFGPRKLFTGFYTKFGNGCQADQNNLTLLASAGCRVSNGDGNTEFDGASLQVTIKHCVIRQFGLAINSQNMAIQNNIGVMFNSLEM